MFCRKCGRKKVTKRSAGVFFCQRCGMLPGALNMDRAGFPAPEVKPEGASAECADYIFAERAPRIKATWRNIE